MLANFSSFTKKRYDPYSKFIHSIGEILEALAAFNKSDMPDICLGNVNAREMYKSRIAAMEREDMRVYMSCVYVCSPFNRI